MEVKQVYENGKTKQKLVTIPKKSNINKGDFVTIEKTEDINLIKRCSK